MRVLLIACLLSLTAGCGDVGSRVAIEFGGQIIREALCAKPCLDLFHGDAKQSENTAPSE